MECPRCHAAAMEFESVEVMRCPVCGFDPFKHDLKSGTPVIMAGPGRARRREETAGPELSPDSAPRRDIRRIAKQPPSMGVGGDPHAPIAIDLPNHLALGDTSMLDDRAIMRLEGRVQEAQVALGRGDKVAARAALREVLDVHDLSDNVWVFLAALAETRAEQRECLEEALAHNPQNNRAVEALLRLDGKLDRPDFTSARRLEPGQVAGEQVGCPRCGGRFIYDVYEKQVACESCGYRAVDADDLGRTGIQTTLQEGLLRRKLHGQPWQIGGRWLRCTNCGATTTLSRHTLAQTCRFCGSRHVVQEGANLQFEQPDFMIPYALDEREAQARVKRHLSSGMRLVTRFFADAVERIELHGVYLPFWVFDAEMSVKWSWTNAPDCGNWPVLLGDVLFFAAETPERKLLERLEPFDMLGSVDYTPRLLAEFPAELYTIDVDRASLDVRRKLARLAEHQARPSLQMRRPSSGYQRGAFGTRSTASPSAFGGGTFKVTLGAGGISAHSGERTDPGRLMLNATTRHMSYRFGLLPVWIGRMIEADGDVQTVLVNGQTGEVALGGRET